MLNLKRKDMSSEVTEQDISPNFNKRYLFKVFPNEPFQDFFWCIERPPEGTNERRDHALINDQIKIFSKTDDHVCSMILELGGNKHKDIDEFCIFHYAYLNDLPIEYKASSLFDFPDEYISKIKFKLNKESYQNFFMMNEEFSSSDDGSSE